MSKFLSLLTCCLVLFTGTGYGQNLDETQTSFLQKQAKTICADETLSSTTWKPLAAQLKNKRIVIGHNFHIAKYNEKEQVMGEMLASKYGHEMYSLGVFAGGGAFANNGGQEEHRKPADTNQLDIQHVIGTTPGFATYLHIPKSRHQGTLWLDQPIVVNNTFIDLKNSNTMILSKHFDGLLFLDKVSVPEKP